MIPSNLHLCVIVRRVDEKIEGRYDDTMLLHINRDIIFISYITLTINFIASHMFNHLFRLSVFTYLGNDWLTSTLLPLAN